MERAICRQSASDASPGNTAKMGMYIGHDMNEQIDYNKARNFTPQVSWSSVRLQYSYGSYGPKY